MRSMDRRDVDQAVGEMVGVLTPHKSKGLAMSGRTLDWSCWTRRPMSPTTCWRTLGMLRSPDNGHLPFDLVIRDNVSPGDVLRIVTTCAWHRDRPIRAASLPWV